MSGVTEDPGWQMIDHCCRFCLGRVLRRDQEFRCSGCGSSGRARADAICGCGIVVNGKRHHRCMTNPTRNPANPSEIVIAFDGVQVSGTGA